MSKIVVCLKPTKANLFNNNDNEMMSLSPYDMEALNKSLAIKNAYGHEIICLCMGAICAEDILYKCIAMGADQAILLNDIKFAASDTHATSLIVSVAIQKIGDVMFVLCGEKSIDGETGQVPVELAGMLNWLYIPNVIDIIAQSGCRAKLVISDFITISHVEAVPPFVAIISSLSMEEPPIGLLAIKRARKRAITVWNSRDLSFPEDFNFSAESKTKVMGTENYFIKKQPIIITDKSDIDLALEIDMILNENWNTGERN